MGNRSYSPAELAWLRENYPRVGTVGVAAAFEAEFGYARSRCALCTQAHKMGLYVTKNPQVTRGGAERRVRWSQEPEMCAWMLEHDHGRIPDTIDAFEAAFGFRLSRGQVSTFRTTHGTASRRGRHWFDVPVGTVRDTGKGYRLVKVRELPEVPGSKDNWEPEHHLAYKEAYGPIPEGHVVMAADGDAHNVAPENLVAVPKRLAGILNNGPRWHDRESLLAAVALAKTRKAIRDLEFATPRRCAVCGREFVPPREKGEAYNQKTCEPCLAAGRKANQHSKYR